jgi:hypothetical protein
LKRIDAADGRTADLARVNAPTSGGAIIIIVRPIPSVPKPPVLGRTNLGRDRGRLRRWWGRRRRLPRLKLSPGSPQGVRGFLFLHLSYSDQEPPYRRDVERLHGFRDGGLLVRRFKSAERLTKVGDAPPGHHPSPGIAGRPDQSSIVPGASFPFGLTSMRYAAMALKARRPTTPTAECGVRRNRRWLAITPARPPPHTQPENWRTRLDD